MVLGGLIEDDGTKSENRVPCLGHIPILGELFRTRNTDKTKTDILIFLRPKILRDDRQAAYETDAKYNYMRDEQRRLTRTTRPLPLLPFTAGRCAAGHSPARPRAACSAPRSSVRRVTSRHAYRGAERRRTARWPRRAASTPAAGSPAATRPHPPPSSEPRRERRHERRASTRPSQRCPMRACRSRSPAATACSCRGVDEASPSASTADTPRPRRWPRCAATCAGRCGSTRGRKRRVRPAAARDLRGRRRMRCRRSRVWMTPPIWRTSRRNCPSRRTCSTARMTRRSSA